MCGCDFIAGQSAIGVMGPGVNNGPNEQSKGYGLYLYLVDGNAFDHHGGRVVSLEPVIRQLPEHRIKM